MRGTCTLQILTILVVGLCLTVVPAAAQEESPSTPIGFHRYTLNEGWNLLSFPFIPSGATVRDVFENHITGGESPETSDRIMAFDPTFGAWLTAWRGSNGSWQGPLAHTELRYDWAYWVQIRSGHVPEEELIVMGKAFNEPIVDRGTYEAGYHIISPIWAGELELGQTGLAEAGFQEQHFLPGDPDDFTGHVSPHILTPITEESFKLAWLNPHHNRWVSNIGSFEPGRGYIMYITNSINWSFYHRPDLEHGMSTSSPPPGNPTVHKAIPGDTPMPVDQVIAPGRRQTRSSPTGTQKEER